MSKVLLALSGGLDSAVLAALLRKEETQVTAVSFNYGSKHGKFERQSAQELCLHYGMVHMTLPIISAMGAIQSSLLDNDKPIPEGHYQEESMRQTVVPGRNLIFISLMAGVAESMKIDTIAIGAHAGDHFIYPDCRPAFIKAAGDTVRLSSYNKVQLIAPFMLFDKEKIVRLGTELKVPFEKTRTCYKPQATACGKCGSCQERLDAFAKNGIDDPIEYESREILPRKT